MSLNTLIYSKLKKNSKNISIEKYISDIQDKVFYIQENDKSTYYKNRIKSLEEGYKELLEIKEFKPINYVSNQLFYTIGMIIIENKIVYLLDDNNQTIKLNTSYTKYSLFSGQVVALKGKNLEGLEIIVDEFYTKPVLDTNFSENKIDFDIKIASGPYYNNNLEPLMKVLEEKKDIIILLGPFITAKDMEEISDPTEGFKRILDMLQKYQRSNISSKIILILSTEDIFTDLLYPQNSYDINSDRIYSFSNPSQFFISDFLFSVTTKDLLLNLYSKEQQNINSEPKERVANNLVFQNSFYPTITDDVVDYNLLSSYLTDTAPNFYIISSKFKPFFKKIGPTYFLNTGFQSKTEYKQMINIEIKGTNIKVEMEAFSEGTELSSKL
ncbi:DNA polymerase alpha-primase complex polymerase-associated subunit B [Spraguea lophii 42_110]|uniref:DNA polymerase alpha subunit B n=1 Tax=Spraguea lophii (strain 42_110) TaxID=1358809 RepID=S7WAK0_SPRLO|nr:DNA polymerase alpha-primase complex polymerase-associated subunit B [Spraguea lophii 42_110]